MEFFDSHAHYNDEKFKDDRDEIIKETIEDGITKFVCAGYDLESSKKAIEIANEYEEIYAIVGISPNDVNNINEINEIRKLAKNKKVVAIGEIGLDYYWYTNNKEIQKQFFIEQIKIANELNLPIVIHSRDAYIDTIQILKENFVDKKGVFHCCQTNEQMVREALELGFYISFAGSITFKNASKSIEIIKNVPLDRIMIETDSPYLTPEPNRGKRNDCRNVKYVAQKIAEIKEISIDKIAEITYNNARRIFKIN